MSWILRLPTLKENIENPQRAAIVAAVASTAPDPRFVDWSIQLIETQVRRDEPCPDGSYRTLKGGAGSRNALSTYSRCIYEGSEFVGFMSAFLCSQTTMEEILKSSSRNEFWSVLTKAERDAPTDSEVVSDGTFHIVISHAFWNCLLIDQHKFIDTMIHHVTRWFSGYRIAGVAWSAFNEYIKGIEVIELRLGELLGCLSRTELNSDPEDRLSLEVPRDARFRMYHLRPKLSLLVRSSDSKAFGPFRDVFRHLDRARKPRALSAKLSADLYRRCFHGRVFRDCSYDIRATGELLGWQDEDQWGAFYGYWKAALALEGPKGIKLHSTLVELFESQPELLVPGAFAVT